MNEALNAALNEAGTRVVVVGNGMAAARLVAELRSRDEDLRITVYGEEDHPAYNRILLADVLAGRYPAKSIALPCRGEGVDVRRGVAVTAIDRAARTVTGADGSTTAYDALVLATGSSPVLPPLRGLHDTAGDLRRGVFSFRTLDDCAGLLAAVGQADAGRLPRVVVIGGGLLGVGAARALAQRGLPVELVHQAPHLMERHLDEPAGAALRRTLAAAGVVTYTECRARAVLGSPTGDGAVTGVELADGYILDCDLVVLACGVRPRVRLAREADLTVAQGVVVDDTLRSVCDPSVYAIGDCAQHRGELYGLVGPAWEQATVLAEVLAARMNGREPEAAYRGSLTVTRLTAAGIDIAAFGEAHATPRDADVIQLANAARGSYQKVVIRDQVVVGGILVGDLATVGTLTLAYERGEPLPPDRLHLITTGVHT
jgi:assimilatory nitrate reductase electron transfer subunit